MNRQDWQSCGLWLWHSLDLSLTFFCLPWKCINPFMTSGFVYYNSLDLSFSSIRGVWLVIIPTMFYRNSFIKWNGVDPDQTPRSAASDLGLRCFLMSLLWDARLKWVNSSKGTYFWLRLALCFVQNYRTLYRTFYKVRSHHATVRYI